MQRELKFRAWNIERGGFTTWEEDPYNVRDFIGDKRYIIQQFTGLKDKNGKEIYEGDIVRYWLLSSEKSDGVASVKFGKCGVSSYDGTTFFTEGFFLEETIGILNPEIIEVVGNIYENPALLSTTYRIEECMEKKLDLSMEVLNVVRQSIQESIKTSLNGYGSPMLKMVTEVVSEHDAELRTIMREALSQVVASPEFRVSVKEAFLHKVARTLVENLDGAVKQAADKLKQDPTIKAQMVLAIQSIVDSAK